MSRSTIQRVSKLDPRVGPIAGVLQRASDRDLKPFTGWLQLTQMLEAVRRSATGP
jgi:hypothetical protein